MNKLIFISFLLFFGLQGCFIGTGTHGSLQGYQYEIPKSKLEIVVNNVIENNPKIHRVTPEENFFIEGNDTIYDNGYNDGLEYLTINIQSDKGVCTFIFRYYGSDYEWSSSKSSKFFICYAFDKNGNGGSEGNGDINRNLKTRLINLFETELVQNVDSELSLTHTLSK